jgi:small subunit ribosomal protein S21
MQVDNKGRLQRPALFFQLKGYRLTGSTTNLARKGVNGMAHVQLQPGESQEQLLKRFRKSVAKSGILSTVRRKRWYVSKSELRRIQKKKAIRRARRKQRKYSAF